MVGDDGRGMVWPEDVPPEVALQAKAREAEPAAKKPAAARGLAVVKSPTEAPRKTATRATAKPRAARGDGTETSKAKKPRGKKARDGALDRTADGAGATLPSTPAGEGVLIPIAAPAAKPGAGQRAGAHRRSERTPASPPSVDPPTAPKPVTEHARPQATAPGRAGVGKTKREIPPYLRVVK